MSTKQIDLAIECKNRHKPIKGKAFFEVNSEEAEGIDFDFVIVNGVRYEKPQNQPDE